MKKLLALLLALALVLGLFACSKKDPVDQPEATETTGEATADDKYTHTFTQFGNARIQIVGSEFVKNDDEEDILRIYYEYTNTDKTLCGHYPNTALNFLSVTQDGSDCLGYSFTPWDESYIPEDGNSNMYVQPGRTMRNTVCFQCDPNGGPVKLSCYVMVGSWMYNPDDIQPFEFEVDPADLMGAPAPFVLPPITDPTYTDGLAASGVYGFADNEISINGVELTKDYDGVDVLRVNLTVTNNEKESWSPALICDLELYQDGIGLPYPSIWDLEEPTAEDEAYETDLEPGETVDCNALFYLRNQNPVEAVVENTGGVTLGACFDVKALFDASAAADQAAASAATAAEAAARKALVGTWLQRDSDWEDTYIFNADGSGMLISGPEYPFTYAVNGDTLTLTYGPDDEEEFTISVAGDLLTMIDMWDEELLLDKKTEEVPEPAIDQTEAAKATEATEASAPTLDKFIIGTWIDMESGYYETFTFHADGTGLYSYIDGSLWEFTFTYDVCEDDSVDIHYDDGDEGGFWIEIEDADTILITNSAVVDMVFVRE